MKRRHWCLIGLALALLAACVGVWKWSERPPYRSLAGARLISMYIDGDTVNRFFLVSRAAAGQEIEMAKEGFELTYSENEGRQGTGQHGEHVSVSEYGDPGRAPSTLVRLSTEHPSVWERASAWAYHVTGRDGLPLSPVTVSLGFPVPSTPARGHP